MRRAEATRFRTRLADDSRYFSSMEYQQLWRRLAAKLSSNDRGYADYMTARYFSAPRNHHENAPPRAQSASSEALMKSESTPVDPEDMARFMREHGGLTPIQYAMAQFPENAKAVAEDYPHLVPPWLRKKSK